MSKRRTLVAAVGAGALLIAWFFLISGIPEMHRAKEQIRRLMRDPVGVQFREVSIERRPGPIRYVVCGEYNAKNGFGAYTGFERFYAFPDGDVKIQGRYDRFEAGWYEFCHR
jgi:hypothetical protein